MFLAPYQAPRAVLRREFDARGQRVVVLADPPRKVAGVAYVKASHSVLQDIHEIRLLSLQSPRGYLTRDFLSVLGSMVRIDRPQVKTSFRPRTCPFCPDILGLSNS